MRLRKFLENFYRFFRKVRHGADKKGSYPPLFGSDGGVSRLAGSAGYYIQYTYVVLLSV